MWIAVGDDGMKDGWVLNDPRYGCIDLWVQEPRLHISPAYTGDSSIYLHIVTVGPSEQASDFSCFGFFRLSVVF